MKRKITIILTIAAMTLFVGSIRQLTTVNAGSPQTMISTAKISNLGSEPVSCEDTAGGSIILFKSGFEIATMVADGSGLTYLASENISVPIIRFSVPTALNFPQFRRHPHH